MANEVHMDTEAVGRIGKTFGDLGEIVDAVNKVLEGLLMVLRTTAFVGMFGGWALQSYIEQVQPYVERLANQLKEIGKDVLGAVQAFENGDAEGSTRFH